MSRGPDQNSLRADAWQTIRLLFKGTGFTIRDLLMAIPHTKESTFSRWLTNLERHGYLRRNGRRTDGTTRKRRYHLASQQRHHPVACERCGRPLTSRVCLAPAGTEGTEGTQGERRLT